MAVTSDTAIELPSEFEELIEHLRDSANARAVFGEPVEREGRTVIPVAKIGMGFGGGFGPVTEDTAAADGEGGSGVGGGGGAMARPVGALEIT